jgi:predicted ferric reductase
MNILKKNPGWTIIIALSVSPVVLWFFLTPLSLRFYNLSLTLTGIGELFALIGTVMFALGLILSTRLKIFEDYFGGMNKVYVAHHLVGSIAFIFLLIHPLANAASLLPYSLKSAALYILPGLDWSINIGISALLLMMSLLIITFFISIPYQIWRFTHKFLGLAFFLAAIHGFYVSSDISRFPLMKGYMLIFLLGGLAAYTYKTILGRFLIKQYRYAVSEVRTLEDGVTEISLTPVREKMLYTSGQFMFIGFQGNGVPREVHPFSISSSDTEAVLKITAKAEGDYTKKLVNLKQGDTALIEGSFGRFSYKRFSQKQQIWIAGGIGITPFISMARNVDPNYAVDLYYTVRTEKEATYLSDLQTLASQRSSFRVIPYFSKTQGRLTAEIIAKTSGDLLTKDIFICGSPPMMKSMRKQLLALHISEERIHSEEFQLL